VTDKRPAASATPADAAAPAVAAVDAARARLAELAEPADGDGMPVAAHVTVYDEVHDVLQGTLAGLGS
jgi:hypothetical protein